MTCSSLAFCTPCSTNTTAAVPSPVTRHVQHEQRHTGRIVLDRLISYKTLLFKMQTRRTCKQHGVAHAAVGDDMHGGGRDYRQLQAQKMREPRCGRSIDNECHLYIDSHVVEHNAEYLKIR